MTYPVSDAQLAQLLYLVSDARAMNVNALVASWIARVKSLPIQATATPSAQATHKPTDFTSYLTEENQT